MAAGARKPLALMIGLEANKLRGKGHAEPDGDEGGYGGGGDDGDEGPDEMRPEHDDDGLIQACQDEIDAMKKQDAKGMNDARIHWMEIYMSHQDGEE